MPAAGRGLLVQNLARLGVDEPAEFDLWTAVLTGLATQQNFVTAGASQVQFIADIDYNIAGMSFAPRGGRYGVIGISLLHVDYGAMQETIRANNDDGFVDLGTFSPSAYAIGVGYARALTDDDRPRMHRPDPNRRAHIVAATGADRDARRVARHRRDAITVDEHLGRDDRGVMTERGVVHLDVVAAGSVSRAPMEAFTLPSCA